MHKDKDKQREATRERVRRYRAKAKGVTSKGVTQGVTGQGMTGSNVTPEQGLIDAHTLDMVNAACGDKLGASAIPNYGLPDCECKHCQQARANKSKAIINHGPHKTEAELGCNEYNRVALPSDPDYAGVGQDLCVEAVQ